VSAVLASIVVSMQQISPGQRNFSIGNSDIVAQSDHSGQWKIGVYLLLALFDLLSFPFNDEHNCTSPACNV